MARHLYILVLLAGLLSSSLSAVLFNPSILFANLKPSTRSPIPINPFFYHVLSPLTTLSTSAMPGQTTTTPGTTTETTTQTTTMLSTTPSTTLPPNFCTTSADCPIGTCCRDLNNNVLVMSEVFDATGPYKLRTARNGTCSNSRAQLGERCNDFCACEIGMTCFRDVNKPCCEPAVCQYQAALEKNMQLWMRCFEDDKCEVFEDDSSEEDDDSDEALRNSTNTVGKKFRVPTHLVPTVKSLIAKQKDDTDSSDSEELEFKRLFNDSLIANLTRALFKNEDSDADSGSSEEDELELLLQSIVNDFLNKTNIRSSGSTTTSSPPSSTTESLLGLFYNAQSHKNLLLDTKSLALNNFVDLKHGFTKQASIQTQQNQVKTNLLQTSHMTHSENQVRNMLLNQMNVGKSSQLTQAQEATNKQMTALNSQIQEFANSETMRILGALQAGHMLMNGNQAQQAMASQVPSQTTLDPLTAMLAESIASQLMIPKPGASHLSQSMSQSVGAQQPGLMSMRQPLPGGGMLNINVNSQNVATTTPPATLPDLTFLAGNIDPNSKLAPKLKRLQALLAIKKSQAPKPTSPPTIFTTTTAAPLPVQLLPNAMEMMTAFQIINGQSNGNNQQQITNLLNMATNNQVNTQNTQNTQSASNIQNMAMLQAMGLMPPPTTQSPGNPAWNVPQTANAAKAREAMKLLQVIKKKKESRKLKKLRESKSNKQILNLDKVVVNSLGAKDSSTRNAIKQLQALRMVKDGRNGTRVGSNRLASTNITGSTSEESTEEIDDSEETTNLTLSMKKWKNATDEDDSSDESDEEINTLLIQILAELNTKPNVTTAQPTTPTTATTTTTSTTTGTSTSPSTTTLLSSTPTTATTTENRFIQNVLKQRQLQQNMQLNQNLLQNQKSGRKQMLDLKALSWNDVVNYFKTKG